MNRNIKNRFSVRKMLDRYETTFFAIYGVFVLILSLFASITYLKNIEFATPFRKIVAIIICTIGLFTTNNVSSIGEKTPFIYELARLLAPVMTGYSIFKFIESGIRYFFMPLNFLFPKKRLLIFGNNEHSKAFAYNSSKTTGDKSFDVIVIADDEDTSKEEKLKLQRSRIFLHTFTTYKGVDDANNLRESQLKQLFVRKYRNIALLHDDPLTNYLIFQSIINLKNQQDKYDDWNVTIVLKSNDLNVTKSIENYYNACDKKEIKLIIFSEEELEAIDLFKPDKYNSAAQDKHLFGIYNNCVDINGGDINIKNPNVLIVDFNECSQEVLKKTIQTFGLNDSGVKPCITILDKNENKVINYIAKNMPAISEICDFDIINKEIDSIDCEIAIRKLIDNGLSHIFVCHKNDVENIAFLNNIKIILDENANNNDTYICIRMEEDSDLISAISKEENTKNKYHIFNFGTLHYILNSEYIFRELWEQQAMEVNMNYANINGYNKENKTKEQLWSELSYAHKDSNRAVALNKPFFNSLIKTLNTNSITKCETIIKDNSTDDTKDNNGLTSKDKKIIDIVKGNEKMYLLSSLEHTRWMNFNVSRGYGSINKKVEERCKKLVNKTILNKKMPVYITTHEDQIEFEKLFKSDPETIKNDVCNIIWYSKD